MALAVPNFSEGRDQDAIAAIAAAFARAELLDRHSDEVHNRTVLSLAAPPSRLWGALTAGARACIERIDISAAYRRPPVHRRARRLPGRLARRDRPRRGA